MEHGNYAYGMWVVAAFNVGLFLFFTLSYMVPKGKIEWRNMGLFTAFLVALFAEMYGFPLTVFLLTGWLGDAYPVLDPFSHKFGHLWVVLFGGSTFVWAMVMGLSLILLVAGFALLSKGWQQIHAAKGRLVNDGVYAYVCHPQYTGLFLLTLAFIIQWPTLLTVLMWPIVIYGYISLSKHEENSVRNVFGQAYDDYLKRTPKFFPPLSQWKSFLTVKISEN